MKEFKSARVEAVKAYAAEHYNEKGWDLVHETYSDLDIYRIVKHQLSAEGAIKKVAEHIAPKPEHRYEIQGMAWNDDSDIPFDHTIQVDDKIDPAAPNGYFKNGKPRPVSKARMAELVAAGVIAA